MQFFRFWISSCDERGTLPQCRAAKLTAKSFFDHVENHVSKRFKCGECDRGYSSRRCLDEHVHREHGEGRGVFHHCQFSNCDFKSRFAPLRGLICSYCLISLIFPLQVQTGGCPAQEGKARRPESEIGAGCQVQVRNGGRGGDLSLLQEEVQALAIPQRA